MTDGAACDCVGGPGEAAGVVVAGAVVDVLVPVVTWDRAWAWRPVQGGGRPPPGHLGGSGAGRGGFPGCCRSAGVACVAAGGHPAGRFAAAAFALAVALWMGSAGRGEEGVETAEEDDDEEEVVVLGDGGCAAMPAGAALRAAAVSAAASAGRIEGVSPGSGLGDGGWRGPAATRRPGGPFWSAAVCGEGVGLRSPPCGLGCAGLLQCGRACASASAGGDSSRGLHSGVRGGWIWGFRAVSGWHVWVTGRAGCAVGRGALHRECVWVAICGGRRGSLGGGICGGRLWVFGPGGGGRVPGVGLCALVGVCGRLLGDRGGRGRGCGAGFACGVSVYVFACSGGLERFLVGREIWRRSFPSFAAAARILHMRVRICRTSWSVVGGGCFRGQLRPMLRRTLWTSWYPQVRGCYGLGGGVLLCVGACFDLWVRGGDGPHPGLGSCGRPASLDPQGQAEHGQFYMVACPPRGDFGQGSGLAMVPRQRDAPEDPVWGGGLPYRPGGHGPRGKHGVGCPDDPLWSTATATPRKQGYQRPPNRRRPFSSSLQPTRTPTNSCCTAANCSG